MFKVIQCVQMWTMTSHDQWPGITRCDHISIIIVCHHIVISFQLPGHSWSHEDLIWSKTNLLLHFTESDQVWPDVNSDQVWPDFTSDQVWPDSTRCDHSNIAIACYHLVTSCQLPGHIRSQLVTWGPKLDQDQSLREGFRSLTPKAREE